MLFVTAAAFAFAAPSAHAQFKMPSALGGSSSSSSSSSDAAAAQDALVKSFVSSQSEVLAAQALLTKAYGLKEDAARIEASQTALQSGAVDKDTLQKAVEVSAQANEAIAAKQAKKTVLTAEEKQSYVASLPHFAKGVIGIHKVLDEARKFVSTAKGSMGSGLSSMGSAMTKLKAGMYVAKASPSYAKSLFDTFKKTVSIGKSNGIKMPADATAALGDL
jgi:hypothetical protein